VPIFTLDLAAQAEPFGIRAICIAPETVLTERNQKRIPAARQEALRQRHLISRLGWPQLSRSLRSTWPPNVHHG
jgi:3-oxoacyl-[acyl-carrier protein] reductase